VRLEDGFRFSFWANENREPPHIHVRKADSAAKWWLDPITEDYSGGIGIHFPRIDEDVSVDNLLRPELVVRPTVLPSIQSEAS
jgi:hypothetical protein